MRYYSRIVKKYRRGEVVFSENSECDGMYIIDSGMVRVYKSVVAGTGLKEVELCRLGPKAMFGEMAMIDESRRSATVQAVEPTSCTIITRKIFEDQLSHIPSWMVNMIRILVHRLRETNDKLRHTIEQFDSNAANNDDMGGIITVHEEKFQSDTGLNAIKPTASHTLKTLLKSEDIIEDLFDSKEPRP